MKTLLFTFDSAESRSQFVDILKSKFDPEAESAQNADLVIQSLKTAIEDPSVVSSEHRHCSVWVSGKKIIEGDFRKMNERFMQECGVHSASVVLKELKNNEWCDIRARRLQ